MSTTIWSGGAAAGLYLGTGLILALLVHTYYPGALGMREWIRVVLSWPLIFFLGSKEDLPGALKKLVATIALLCVSNTVLAHDIYSNLRDRDGHLCCGGQDCKPVVAIALPNGNYYLPETGETIPADMATPSPDERFHHCFYYPMATEFDRSGSVWESKPKTRCFFAPMNSM